MAPWCLSQKCHLALLGTGSFATNLSSIDLSIKGDICHTWGQVYTTCLRELEKEFYEVKEQLRKMTKKYGVRMRLTRRQKDFIGLNEKIRLYIINNKPMDTKASTEQYGKRMVHCSKFKYERRRWTTEQNLALQAIYRIRLTNMEQVLSQTSPK